MAQDPFLGATDHLPDAVLAAPVRMLLSHHELLLSFPQQCCLAVISAFQIARKVFRHTSELTYALLESGEVFALEAVEMQPVLAEAPLDNLAHWLRHRVAVLLRHLHHQVQHLAKLAVVCLSKVVSFLFCLFDIGVDLVTEGVN
mmetsp:Transcript_28044/g.37453  ORF Transcript_28044/g.37453 Transcript_28044/m.37453 type:complete len:144 (-) Transcript_28044:1018-1449(-)